MGPWVRRARSTRRVDTPRAERWRAVPPWGQVLVELAGALGSASASSFPVKVGTDLAQIGAGFYDFVTPIEPGGPILAVNPAGDLPPF